MSMSDCTADCTFAWRTSECDKSRLRAKPIHSGCHITASQAFKSRYEFFKCRAIMLRSLRSCTKLRRTPSLNRTPRSR